MEVCVPRNTSGHLDISSSTGSSTDPHNPIQHSSSDLSMNELKTCLTEFLNIEEIGISTNGVNLSPRKDGIGNVVTDYECKVSDKSTSGDLASEKHFGKCATFPPFHGPKISGDVVLGEKGKNKEDITAEVSEVNGSGKASDQCYSRSISLPTPLKLVSAMKGSREKQGIPPKKLSVTWAPDV
ncbi:hypothetical protein CDL12_15417 [Handroanthus impetiginosus]|uniref:Uncharacterized protein n=1 Tax=Handroanthus impetiginosus TaxID=429701 RepID=A0A2G9H366_9LAMI|nr:hypothetical protein CDL12_15417 [Handroanthus impetiginosus]